MTPTNPGNSAEQGGRVLVLEPEGDLAGKIRAALHEAAPTAQVDLAQSLEEAQHLVLNDRPDLFVLDVDAVPDLGQEFLYDLRTSHPNARAIVLTGTHLAAHREQAAGLGAIHFLEKPFPHGDFVDLVQALLSPSTNAESEKFQGTLSDLHLADIIQLKCMSGSSAALQFTGPQGEKARVYFESGQVRHATAPGKEGVAAFNEIVNWKGGQISEVTGAAQSPRTIDLDWQILLMDAVRNIDETRDAELTAAATAASTSGARKILVIDDSLMLLSFVKEILSEANYAVTTAATAAEGLASAAREVPDLILLDYVLPDMKGDDVCQRLSEDPATAKARIVYMSGFGADLQPDQIKSVNVIGSLNKPFTSDLLVKTVENYMLKDPSEPESKPVETKTTSSVAENAWPEPDRAETQWPDPASHATETPVTTTSWPEPESHASKPAESRPSWPEPEPAPAAWEKSDSGSEKAIEVSPAESTETAAETAGIAAGAGAASDAWWSAPVSTAAPAWSEPKAASSSAGFESPSTAESAETPAEAPLPVNGTFFSGDTSFFSLNGALHTIGKEKLTGTLRSFWGKETVDLLAKKGEVILVTTRDPQLYCPEAPITLVNVDAEQTERARAQQRETGCPFFLTLAREGLILQEPAVQLVQHYGQKLFAQLWTARKVRFVFEQSDSLPEYAAEVPGENDIDHWVLSTLRSIQFQDLGDKAEGDGGNIPAFTRDGFERVQKLRLTVAEAQFASQFNGARSIAQIAKNLRLDFKFARLTLYRFLALEIVECWPPTAPNAKPEKRGFFQKLGFGE
ncbi:MAG: response regulator [Verrucomicrobiota bacterium]|nr:response regulator [Verrucomicrobiota bacterium]